MEMINVYPSDGYLKNPIPKEFTGIVKYNYLPTPIIEYYKNGKTHRVDGPAVIFKDGYREFYYKGIYYYNIEDWLGKLSEEEKMLALFNINEWNNKEWKW